MTIWLRCAMVGALAIGMAGYGASAAVAQDIDDDFEDDFGDEDFDDFEDDDFDDFEEDDLDDFDDFEDDVEADVDEPAEPVEPEVAPLTLGEGEIRVDGFVEVNLSSNFVAEPLSLAPDIYYGVNDDLTVGLVHSGVGTTGMFLLSGSGLCITGEDSGCPDVYNNVGVNALFGFMDDDLELAAEGGLFINSLSDPFMMTLKAGLVGRWTSDDLQVAFSPNVHIALNERDINQDLIFLPVAAYYSVTPELALGGQTGLWGQVDELGDTWAVPLSLIADYQINEELSAGAAFTFPFLLGEFNDTDIRTLNLFVSYRM